MDSQKNMHIWKTSNLTISAIIPFYNDSGTIARAINSALNQTVPPNEIIIVDDSSEKEERAALQLTIDQTLSALDGCKSKMPSFTLLRNTKNVGPSGTRNRAWESATSTYIAFLDSDDVWHPWKLEVQSHLMSFHESLALTGTRLQYLSDNTTRVAVGWQYNAPPAVEVKPVRPLAQVLRNRFATSSIMLRRDVKERFNEEMRYSEDNDLWCRILLSNPSNRAANLQAPLTGTFKRHLSHEGPSGNYSEMFKGQLLTIKELGLGELLSPIQMLAAYGSSTLRYAIRIARAYGLSIKAH